MKIKTYLLDISLIIILAAISLFLISPYLNAQYIHIDYPDWIVHAFRAKILQEYGLTSWTHIWSNGISIWKAYQFIPHYLTLAVINIFHVSVTRAMVMLVIGLYVAFRLLIYATLRLIGFNPATSFIASVISFDISQYFGAIGDYSIMFGFTIFPLVLFLWTKFYKGKVQFLYPFICGISFYIHPLLGFMSLALLLVSIIFSSQKFISIKTISQITIMLLASSLFWFPVAHRTAYLYSESGVADQAFLALVISKFSYFGLSLAVLLCLFSSLPQILMPLSKKLAWVKTLCVTIAVYFLLVVIGINVPLPRFIDQFQYTRGIVFIGIGALYTVAPLLQKLLSLKSFFVKIMLAAGVSLSLAESIWFASIYAPPPSNGYDDPVSAYSKKYSKNLSDGKIFTENIGQSSYYSPTTYRFPYSYMSHLDSNEIPPRISQIITYASFSTLVPQANINRVTDYLKITGTKYLFLDETSPFTQTFLINGKASFIDLGTITVPSSVTHVFQTSWEPKDAIMINPRYSNSMDHFPFTLDLSKPSGQTVLDSDVEQFVNILEMPDNQPLPMQYPAQDQITVSLPADSQSNLIYINESFDKEWIALYNDVEQPIKPVGPNYMLVTLNSKPNGGTLLLKHNWPVSFYLTWLFLGVFPVILGLNQILQFLTSRIVAKGEKK